MASSKERWGAAVGLDGMRGKGTPDAPDKGGDDASGHPESQAGKRFSSGLANECQIVQRTN